MENYIGKMNFINIPAIFLIVALFSFLFLF